MGSDPLAGSAWVGLIAMTLVLVALSRLRELEDLPRPMARRLTPILGMGILLLGSQTILIVLGVDARKTLAARAIEDVLNMAVAAVSMGVVLYLFRRWDRAAYGLAEVLFAAAAAGYAGWRASEGPLARTVAFGAAIYIVVRGLDNIAQARHSKEETPLTRWLDARYPRNSPEPSEGDGEKASQDQRGARTDTDGS